MFSTRYEGLCCRQERAGPQLCTFAYVNTSSPPPAVGHVLYSSWQQPVSVHQCFDGLLDPPWTSWYNTLKLASCHVHRPCLNPLQSPHRVITSKQESSTSLVSQLSVSYMISHHRS